MSKILNESTVYPGWEAPKSEMAVEEKALLITARQNYIFSYAKTGAALGFAVSIYNLFERFDITEENFNFSLIMIIVAIHVAAASTMGYLLGIVFAKIYKK